MDGALQMLSAIGDVGIPLPPGLLFAWMSEPPTHLISLLVG